MTTTSVENYLKTIYALSQKSNQSPVKTKAIADALKVSLPSVTSMLQSLASEELAVYTPYKGVVLSPKGRSSALNVIRKHRLVEMFLVETLDYTWDEVHNEAEQLEHAVSDDLAERMDRFLGYPKFDPHGDPIPTKDGQIFRRELTPLSDIEPVTQVVIARVTDQDPDLLRHLTKLGIVLESVLEVIDTLSFDGQMTVRNDAGQHTVSQNVASRVMVLAESVEV